jgi:hypothetical protein
MYKFAYLALALCLVACAVVVCLIRRDLVRNSLLLALGGAIWGPISEYWFHRDYWRPTSVFGGAWPEDCIYGAAIAATAGTLYKLFSRRRLAGHGYPRRPWICGAFVVTYVLSMEIFQSILHENSIFISMIVYVGLALVIFVLRPDLLMPGIASAVLMGLGALLGYGIGLNFIVNGQLLLSKFWLLYEHPAGWMILTVPVTEIMWYACWGLLVGVIYEFATGAGLRNAEQPFTRRRSRADKFEDSTSRRP